MGTDTQLRYDRYGFDFIPEMFLPEGCNEYWLRDAQHQTLSLCAESPEYDSNSNDSITNNDNAQNAPSYNAGAWRRLNSDEILILIKNGNYCPDWNNILVRDPFNPVLIRNSNFYGLVRIGSLRNKLLKHHDFCVPAGIHDSTVISCDIGNNVAIQDCAYISHYIIGDHCILSCVNEMQTTNHAKFGNGVIKDGENEQVRVWIDVMNEAGGRSILPFESMTAADAFLWAAYRDDTVLTEMLSKITQDCYGGRRGAYGMVGCHAVIKSCAVIKDAAVGSFCYIKGANKIKNVTLLSSSEEPTQIGEGVELVNGIVGYGSHVFYGSKAVRFIIGRNCNLKYGARLIHSVLGDNSTISCCEILNNLIFPVHEQHHNNSFLVAALVQGLSNMAAAATIGSNHNSRANDGELRAKRGFWPGLAVSLKHPSCFASYTIIAKGDYPFELNIPLPFSLVNNNIHLNRLEVLPAFFWIHNLYALERNSWKSRSRDRRVRKVQYIETDYLAPDTVEEIISALVLLESRLAGTAAVIGEDGEIPYGGLENSRRNQVVVKPRRATAAYREMLHWYAGKTIAEFCNSRPDLDYNSLCALLAGTPETRVMEWINMGGQIVPAFRVDKLRKEIGEGAYCSWDDIHHVYDIWLNEYPLDKTRHAWAVLDMMRQNGIGQDIAWLVTELNKAAAIRRNISVQVYESRAKDFRNPFKRATFRNTAEMEQVLGSVENNPFVLTVQEEGRRFDELVGRVIRRLESNL